MSRGFRSSLAVTEAGYDAMARVKRARIGPKDCKSGPLTRNLDITPAGLAAIADYERDGAGAEMQP